MRRELETICLEVSRFRSEKRKKLDKCETRAEVKEERKKNKARKTKLENASCGGKN